MSGDERSCWRINTLIRLHILSRGKPASRQPATRDSASTANTTNSTRTITTTVKHILFLFCISDWRFHSYWFEKGRESKLGHTERDSQRKEERRRLMERKQESKKERFFVRFFLFSSYFYSSFYSILFVFETWKGLREACRYSPLSTQNHHWKFISFFLVCLIFECCWPVFVLCLVVMVTVSVIVIVIASYLSASSHYSLSLLQKAARKLSTSTHCTCTLSQGPMLTR